LLGLGGSPSLAVSRDGTRYVVALNNGISRMLYARELSSGTFEVIPGTEGAEGPFFSWSGEEVGYFAHSQLFRVRFDGSAEPETLAGASGAPEPHGGTWGADGTIYYSSNQAIWALRGNLTRVPEQIGSFDIDKGELGLRWPTILPDGVTLLYTGWVGPGSADNTLYSLTPGDQPTPVIKGAGYTRYAPSGHLIFARGSELLAIAFDPDSRAPTGSELPVVMDVLVRQDNGVPFFDVAPLDGTFVHAPGDVLVSGPTLAWMDATHESVPEPIVLTGYHESLRYPRLSTDGSELVVTVEDSSVAEDEGGRLSAVVYSLTPGSNPQHVLPGVNTTSPEWDPAGGTLAFATLSAADDAPESTLRIKGAHTSGSGTLLVRDAGPSLVPTAWSSAGDLFYNSMTFDEDFPAFDIYYVSTSGGPAASRLLLDDDYDNYGAVLSPDGNLVAWVHRRPGQDETEVMVTSFPHTEQSPIRPVSHGTDCQEPTWSAAGDRLFYRCDTEMWVREIEADPLRLGEPIPLWSWPFVLDDQWAKANYAYDARGERFVMVSADPIIAKLDLAVVLNWRPSREDDER